MKKMKLLVPFFILLFIIGGCNEDDVVKLSIEQRAFNSLTASEQNEIPISPEASIVEKIVVDDEIAILNDESYNGKKVYSVTFDDTANVEMGLNNIVVYVGLDKKTIIGKGYRE